NIKESIVIFRALAENSPLEAPVAGFNRHLRYMSPATRELVLKARMPEIMAFAEDRKVDPTIVLGIAEATMRLGRIPDLGMYGFAGDEALAVKDFLADTILNVAEDELNLIAPVSEADDSNVGAKAKHLKLAADYRKLAEFHKRRSKEELDKSKIAKDDGRAHTSINANAAMERHKTLAMHCMGLADYHQIQANEAPEDKSDNATPPNEPVKDHDASVPEPPENKVTDKAPKTAKPKKTRTEEDIDRSPLQSIGRRIGGQAGGAIGNTIDPKYKR